MFRKKTLFYVVLSLFSFYVVNNFALPKDDYKLLGTSMLKILTKIAEENKPNPPDLAIENISLRKISDPTDNFNFYKYYANITIKNYGGDLNNAELVIEGNEDQKSALVKNTDKGFSLAKGETYIIDRYEVIFDGNYNGGNLAIYANLKNRTDINPENNAFNVEVFELPTKIEDFSLDEIKDDGSFVIGFEVANPSLNADLITVMASDAVDYPQDEEKYAEVLSGEKVYGYNKIKVSPEILNESEFAEIKMEDPATYSLKFTADPWNDGTPHFVYVKATNPENGYFAISNLIKLSNQKEIDRSDFAKLFVDYADLNLEDSGTYYFEDVRADVWYGPYVQTLYNLGLIKNSSTKYYPEAKMNRGDVLRVVMDFCDLDLEVKPGAPHFEDVAGEDPLYPYLEGFYASGNSFALTEKFMSKSAATKNFLKYLIYECKENS